MKKMWLPHAPTNLIIITSQTAHNVPVTALIGTFGTVGHGP